MFVKHFYASTSTFLPHKIIFICRTQEKQHLKQPKTSRYRHSQERFFKVHVIFLLKLADQKKINKK